MQTSPFKPGYQTSEFWLSGASIILTFLATMGFIHVADINPLLNAIGQIYGGAVGLLTILAIVRSYVQSRTAIKQTILDSQKTA